MERPPRGSLVGSEKNNSIGFQDRVPPLGGSGLHVWTWHLDVDRDILAHLEAVLSNDEWRRVRRFSSHRFARRFIVRRGLLRRILGSYLDLPPQEVQFFYNAHGKPFLVAKLSPKLQFNLSDSGELAALAVGIEYPLGIDIEQLRPFPLDTGPAPYCPSTPVLKQAERAEPPARNHEFFQAWTRREAIAKAEGVGLQMLSDQFSKGEEVDDCSVALGTACALYRDGLHVHQLTLPPGYVGAVATRQEVAKISYFPAY